MLPAMLSWRLAQGNPHPFDELAELDGTDFSQNSDRDLERILEPLTFYRLAGLSNKLCDVQREWLARRFENWYTNTPDPRLDRLNGGGRSKEDDAATQEAIKAGQAERQRQQGESKN